jgi:hypothetical protein
MMVDLPLTASSGYIVKVIDHDNDEFARYFVVCGVADGAAATNLVLASVPEKSGEAIRNASQSEIDGMKVDDFHAIPASQALLPARASAHGGRQGS